MFEDAYIAPDSSTLDQWKELSSKRILIEESINESNFITNDIAREISGGLTSPCEQVLEIVTTSSITRLLKYSCFIVL